MCSINVRSGEHTFTVQIALLDEAVINLVVCHVDLFNTQTGHVDWEGTAGQFQLFKSTLARAAWSLWERLYQALPEETDLDDTVFQKLVRRRIADIAHESDWEQQLAYLHGVKKDKDEDIMTFYKKLVHTNELTGLLPGENPLLNEADIQFIFFEGIPEAWKRIAWQASQSHH